MRIGISTTTGKVLASVVLVGAAASVAGMGTFGGFTSTTTADLNATSGTIVLDGTSGAQGTSVAAAGLLPGDRVERSIVLSRAEGSETFGSVLLTTTAATGNALTGAEGLQLTLEQCSVPWTQVAGTKTLKCSDALTTVLGSQAVLGSEIDLGAATTALNSDAAVSNLRATLTLPEAAGNVLQDKSDTVTFTFDATQRAAEAR